MNYYLQFVKNNDNIILKVLNYYNVGVKKKNNLLCNNYDYKLANNITRARTKILDYAYNNNFTYFLTATISSKYDRSDLKSFIKQVTQAFRNLRKLYNKDLFYLIIPELHSDKKNWHIHGILGGECVELDKYSNSFGYYSLHCLDSLGFNSVSKIRCKDACNIYVTKYITKNLSIGRSKSEHLFYTSHNLKTGVSFPLIKVTPDDLQYIDFDFSSDNIKLKKYFNISFVTELLHNYYNNKDLSFFVDNLSSL